MDDIDEILQSQLSPFTPQKLTSFLTFINFIWVLGIIILVCGLTVLVKTWLLPLLVNQSIYTQQVLAYGVCISAIIGGKKFPPHIGPFIALPGCIGLIFCYLFTLSLHFQRTSSRKRDGLGALFFSFVYGLIAIWYDSSMVGFLSVMALETFLINTVNTFPLFAYLGVAEDKPAVLNSCLSSAILVAISVFLYLNNLEQDYFLRPFRIGLLYLGTFAYFLGLQLLSSKYYLRKVKSSVHAFFNAVTILSGLLAVFLGLLYPDLAYLKGIGGTNIVITMLLRLGEVTRDFGAGLSLSIVGAFLFAIGYFFNSYPQYLIGHGF